METQATKLTSNQGLTFFFVAFITLIVTIRNLDTYSKAAFE